MTIEFDGVNNIIKPSNDAMQIGVSGDTITIPSGATITNSGTANGFSSASFTEAVSITTADNTDTLTLISTDADANSGPNLLLDRNSSSTANQDALGAITFRGRNDAAQDVDYIKLEAVIGDETDGTEDGNFHISNITAGTSKKYISVNRQEICLNEDGENVDIRIEGQDGQFTTDERLVFIDASAGRFSINSSDGSPTVNFHCYNPHSDGYIAKFENTHTNAGQYGINVTFAAAPDNVSQHAIVFEDSSATRFKVWADGDVHNHDGSYATLSDERIKESITDANSQWNDIKALKFKNFKLKDDVRQYGADKADKHLGLIAQEVESVSPNLVKAYPPSKEHILTNSVFGTLYKDGDDIPEDKKIGDIKTEGEDVKGLKQSILYMKGMKALQEAMTRIETLETKVAALEG